MRIGELATRAGVNIETIRYYERRGILPQPPRAPNGHRRYDEASVRFVRAVKEAQSLGFTLAEIDEYLRLSRRRAGSASQALRVRLAAKLDEIDARLASLQRVRDDLARVIGCACQTLDHCTCGAAYLARQGRDPDPLAGRVLHVTNGESAGNTLRRTSLGGAVLSWQDVLVEGPLPDVPPAPLRAVRARFLSECGWGSARTLRDALERRDRIFEQALADGHHVVLWFEHDLYDQLQLVQVLAQAEHGFDAERLELIGVGSFEGRPDFHGLGELTVDELETLWPLRRPVTPELAALGGRAWAAVRAPDPTAIEAFAKSGDTSALPFLSAALRRMLEELPDVRSGLARSERQLLELLAHGPRAPGRLFVESQAREDAPFAGDAWVWRQLSELGKGDTPLVALEDGTRVPDPPPLGDARTFAASTLAITETGRQVVAGEADRVEVLGIDRWLGGTHLRPDHLPRWNAGTSRVSRT
jgi:DNA-binding transcriptional MerR regulator